MQTLSSPSGCLGRILNREHSRRGNDWVGVLNLRAPLEIYTAIRYVLHVCVHY